MSLYSEYFGSVDSFPAVLILMTCVIIQVKRKRLFAQKMQPTARVRDRIREREGDVAVANLEPGLLMRPEAVAEAYRQLYQQPPDAWTFEQEIRPFSEKW
jgi:hypothetical protein